MNEALPQRAQFHHMKEGTQSDWEIIGAEFSEFRSTVVNRIKDHLLLLQGDFGGFPVDRLTHCLQTATALHEAEWASLSTVQSALVFAPDGLC